MRNDIKSCPDPGCGAYHGGHHPGCKLASPEYKAAQLDRVYAAMLEGRAIQGRLGEKVTFWQGKFNQVRQENNKLRKQVARLTGQVSRRQQKDEQKEGFSLPGSFDPLLNAPKIPEGLGDHLTFDDAIQGPMLLVRNYHNDGPWFFYKTPNSWVAWRRASQADCDRLRVEYWMQVEQPAETTG